MGEPVAALDQPKQRLQGVRGKEGEPSWDTAAKKASLEKGAERLCSQESQGQELDVTLSSGKSP